MLVWIAIRLASLYVLVRKMQPGRDPERPTTRVFLIVRSLQRPGDRGRLTVVAHTFS